MRATTTPALSARSLSAGLAAAALTLGLVPGSAAAEEPREAVAVRVKVADQPPVEVATVPRAWPGELLEAQGVPVDGNDLVDVVRDGREVSGKRKRLRQGDVVRVTDVVKERKTKRTKVRRGTVEVPTTKLKPGKRKVVRKGRPGVRKVVAVKTLHNGEPAKYRVVKRELVREPRPRRVLVGRKVGYLSTTTTDTSSTQSVEFLDTGTQLYLRPFVSRDGMIRMELKPPFNYLDTLAKGGQNRKRGKGSSAGTKRTSTQAGSLHITQSDPGRIRTFDTRIKSPLFYH